MVKVFLRGGLGNQMFQYALGLRLALKNKADLVLDTTFLNDRFPRKEITFRTYDLDVFTLTPRFTALSKISRAVPIPAVWLGGDLVLSELKNLIGISRFIKENKDYVFDEKVLQAGGNVTLWGRWQSEKYFADIEKEVRDALRFRHPLTGEAARLADEIRGENSVSLHIRRGDYVAFKSMKAIMGETDISYYARAAEYIGARVPEPHFFVFSDDIAWGRENVTSPFKMTYVSDASRGPKDSHHLELMSLCKHNIITNSTFSWWGAWLNRNPEKIVIAPKRWHTGAIPGQDDIILATWVRI